MKKIVTLMLMLGVAAVSHTAQAANLVGKLWYVIDEATMTATVVASPDGDLYTGEITIPEEIDFAGVCQVTAIGRNAFKDCTELTSVILPETITEFGFSCFRNAGIREMVFPATVQTIGDGAFMDCKNLTTVAIGKNVTSIGKWTFRNCSALQSFNVLRTEAITVGTGAFHGINDECKLNVPDNSVTKFKNDGNWSDFIFVQTLTFTNKNFKYKLVDESQVSCEGLANGTGIPTMNYVLPPSVELYGNDFAVTAISDNAFRDNQISFINLPEGLTTIGEGAFLNCSRLEEVNLPSTLKTSKAQAFAGCDNLYDVKISDPLLLASITFYQADSNPLTFAKYLLNKDLDYVSNLTIPGSVGTIGNYAFSGLSSESVTIEEGVTAIGQQAFGDTEILKLRLPSTLTAIGHAAFLNCQNLMSVVCEATQPPLCANGSAFDGVNTGEVALCVPKDATDQYKVAEAWSKFNNTVGHPEFTGEQRFNGIVYTLSEDALAVVTGYDEEIIAENDGEVIIPPSIDYKGSTYFIKEIGRLAFVDCNVMRSLKLCEGLAVIGYSAFSYCKNLTAVSFPSTVSEIRDDAFYECSLKSVHLNKRYKSNYDVFCYNPLEEVSIEDGNPNFFTPEGSNGVFEMRNGALSLHLGTPTTVISSEVKQIGSCAFHGRKNLTSFTIPENTRMVGRKSFEDCGLTAIHIPGNTFLDSNPFCYCSLESITVARIHPNYDSRHNCNAVMSSKSDLLMVGSINTVIPEETKTIGYEAFKGQAIKSVRLPKNIENISNYAFQDCRNLTDVYCLATTPPKTKSSFDKNKGYVLHVPAESIEAYKAAEGWGSEYFAEYVPLEESEVVGMEKTVTEEPSESSVCTYDLQGRHVNSAARKGIILQRQSDGTVRKVAVR